MTKFDKVIEGVLNNPGMNYKTWMKLAQRTGPEDENGCREFTGARTHGYGNMQVSGTGSLMIRAHRLAFALYYRVNPMGGVVMHRCDNPGCIRIEHLSLGSRADNNADCRAKGRGKYLSGEAHGRAKLTQGAVDEIKRRYEGIWGQQTKLAKEYGVSKSQISQIVKGNRWNN